MCCVSLFCMGYTRPHTGQGKELSFGVWEGIMRSQGEREVEAAGTFHLLSHHPISSPGPFPGQGSTLTGSGLFFLGKKKPSVIPQLPYGRPVSALITFLVTHAPFQSLGKPMGVHLGECQGSTGNALCWLIWDMVFSLHSQNTFLHYGLEEVPHEKP